MSRHTIVNTLQYRLSYTRQVIVIRSFKRLTLSNIMHKFSMFPPTYILFTSSTLLLRRSTNILKTNTLSFDCPGNRLPWTNLKESNIILSIVPIQLRKNTLIQIQSFEKKRKINLLNTIEKTMNALDFDAITTMTMRMMNLQKIKNMQTIVYRSQIWRRIQNIQKKCKSAQRSYNLIVHWMKIS
jgi:hypothetical protein